MAAGDDSFDALLKSGATLNEPASGGSFEDLIKSGAKVIEAPLTEEAPAPTVAPAGSPPIDEAPNRRAADESTGRGPASYQPIDFEQQLATPAEPEPEPVSDRDFAESRDRFVQRQMLGIAEEASNHPQELPPDTGPRAVDPGYRLLASQQTLDDAARIKEIFGSGRFTTQGEVDRNAEIIDLRNKTGLTYSTIAAKLPEFQAQWKQAQFDSLEWMRANPQLAEYVLRNPEGGVHVPSDPGLGKLSKAINEIRANYFHAGAEKLVSNVSETIGAAAKALSPDEDAAKIDAEATAASGKASKALGFDSKESLFKAPAPGLAVQDETSKHINESGSTLLAAHQRAKEASYGMDANLTWWDIARKRRRGEPTALLEQRALDFESLAQPRDLQLGEWGQDLSTTASGMVSSYKVGKDAVKGAAVGALVTGAIGGGVALLYTRNLTIAGQAFVESMPLGAKLGGKGTAYVGTAKLEGGAYYRELQLQGKWPDGTPITEDEAYAGMLICGNLNAALEIGALELSLPSFGALGQLIKTGSRKAAVAAMLKNGSFRSAVWRLSKQLLVTTAAESGEETEQNLTKQSTSYFVHAGSLLAADVKAGVEANLRGEAGPQADWEKYARGLGKPIDLVEGLHEGVDAVGSSVGLGLFGAGTQVIQSKAYHAVTSAVQRAPLVAAQRRAGLAPHDAAAQAGLEIAHHQMLSDQAHESAAVIKALADFDAPNSPTAKADPEGIASAFKSDGLGENVYTRAPELMRWYQDSKVDPEKAAEKDLGPGGYQKLEEALKTGQPLEVPTATFLTGWSTEQKAALAEHTTTKAGLPTPAAIDPAKFKARVDELAKQMDDGPVEPESAGEASFIKVAEDDIANMPGESRLKARQKLSLFRAHVRTYSEVWGQSPDELFGKFSVRVAAGQDPTMEEVLRKRLVTMTVGQRAEEMMRDENTGLPNEVALAATKTPAGQQVAHVSVEGIKWLNDNADHKTADGLYRAVALALHNAGLKPFKAFGDFAFHVKDQATLDKALEAVRKALPENLKGFAINGALGPTLGEASAANQASTDAQVEAGTRAHARRPVVDAQGLPVVDELGNPEVQAAEMPKGLAAGTKAKEVQFSDEKPAPALPAEAVKAVTDLKPEDYFDKAYINQVTGEWTKLGWDAMRRKAHVVSLDLRGLRGANERFDKATGNLMLQRMGLIASELGGRRFDFTRLHGDEYAAQSDNLEELEAFVDELRAVLNAKPVMYEEKEVLDEKTGKPKLTPVAVAFHDGYGDRSLEAADRDLNERKAARKAARKAGLAHGRPRSARPEGDAGAGQGGDSVRAGESDAFAALRQRVGASRTTKKHWKKLLDYFEGGAQGDFPDVPWRIESAAARYANAFTGQGFVDPKGFPGDQAGRDLRRAMSSKGGKGGGLDAQKARMRGQNLVGNAADMEENKKTVPMSRGWYQPADETTLFFQWPTQEESHDQMQKRAVEYDAALAAGATPVSDVDTLVDLMRKEWGVRANETQPVSISVMGNFSDLGPADLEGESDDFRDGYHDGQNGNHAETDDLTDAQQNDYERGRDTARGRPTFQNQTLAEKFIRRHPTLVTGYHVHTVYSDVRGEEEARVHNREARRRIGNMHGLPGSDELTAEAVLGTSPTMEKYLAGRLSRAEEKGLAAIKAQPGLGRTQLARLITTSHTHGSNVVDRLIKRGLIVEKASPGESVRSRLEIVAEIPESKNLPGQAGLERLTAAGSGPVFGGAVITPPGYVPGPLALKENEVTYETGPVWYSAVERAVTSAKQEKNTPAAWLALIEKTAGVRKEEVDFLGLREWMKEVSTPSIDRAQVLEFIRAHALVVTETGLKPGTLTDPMYDSRTLDGRRQGSYREVLFRAPGTPADDYVSQHFGGHGEGLLAHARIAEHTTQDGTPILLIEEIQSDLHQAARQTGYERRSKDIPREVDRRGAAQDVVLKWLSEGDNSYDVRQAASSKKWSPVSKSGNWGAEFQTREEALAEAKKATAAHRQTIYDVSQHWLEHVAKAPQEVVDAFLRHASEGENTNAPPRSPAAPLKTSWDEMVVKRLLRYAAEKGLDRIGWTTGEQQAKRYELSDDASEGMKIRYDQRIPAVFEKLVKKHGGKVEKVKLGGEYTVRPAFSSGWEVVDPMGRDLPNITTREAADQRAAELNAVDDGNRYEVWSVTLPESLRREALTTGFALFERKQEYDIRRAERSSAKKTIGQKRFDTSDLRSGRETLEAYGLPPPGQGKSRGGFNNVRDIYRALQERQRELFGVIKRDDFSDEAKQRLAKGLANIIAEELKPENLETSGAGWYDERYKAALSHLSKLFPELKKDRDARAVFTALVAITSNGQKVLDNYNMAAELFAEYVKTKRLPTRTPKGKRGPQMLKAFKSLQKFMDRHGGPSVLRTILLHEDTVSNHRARAKEMGLDAKSLGDFGADEVVPFASVVISAKLGTFFGNLMGKDGYLTMDMWWARTFNTMRGDIITTPKRVTIENFKKQMANKKLFDRKMDPAEKRDLIASLPLASHITDKQAFAEATRLERIARKEKNYGKKFAVGPRKGEIGAPLTSYESSGNELWKQKSEKLEEAPRNAGDRAFMIAVTKLTQQMLERNDQRLSIADIQALSWFYEQRLIRQLGGKVKSDVSYDEVAEALWVARQDGREKATSADVESVRAARAARTERRASGQARRGGEEGQTGEGLSGRPDLGGRVDEGVAGTSDEQDADLQRRRSLNARLPKVSAPPTTAESYDRMQQESVLRDVLLERGVTPLDDVATMVELMRKQEAILSRTHPPRDIGLSEFNRERVSKDPALQRKAQQLAARYGWEVVTKNVKKGAKSPFMLRSFVDVAEAIAYVEKNRKTAVSVALLDDRPFLGFDKATGTTHETHPLTPHRLFPALDTYEQADGEPGGRRQFHHQGLDRFNEGDLPSEHNSYGMMSGMDGRRVHLPNGESVPVEEIPPSENLPGQASLEAGHRVGLSSLLKQQPEVPADYSGKVRTSKARTISSVAVASKLKEADLAPVHPLQRQLDEHEAQLRDRRGTERLVALDSAGNVLVDHSTGEKSQVTLQRSHINAMLDNGHATVTHNHPSGETFSVEDINLAAVVNLKEIRAVGPSGIVYQLQRPEAGWGGLHPDTHKMRYGEDAGTMTGPPGLDHGAIVGQMRRLRGLLSSADRIGAWAAKRAMDEVVLAAGGDPKDGTNAKGFSQEQWAVFTAEHLPRAFNELSKREGWGWEIRALPPAEGGVAPAAVDRRSAARVQAGPLTTAPWATGSPHTFAFAHNTERAPNVGQTYGQHLEPAGRYLIEVDPGQPPLRGWERGTITFNRPLVIDWGENGLYSDPTNWKAVLSQRYGGLTGRALSTAIAKDGYDGIVTMKDGESSEIVDLTKPGPLSVRSPEQRYFSGPRKKGDGPRGYTVPPAPEALDRLYQIVLNPNADLSTFLHESAHIFLDTLANLAMRPDAPARVRADFAAALKYLGAKTAADLIPKNAKDPKDPAVVRHEKWATNFEHYLYEGKAPSDKLEGAFDRYRMWLTKVYGTVSSAVPGADISDDIRRVFDRLLATDAEIEQRQKRMGAIVPMARAMLNLSVEQFREHIEKWKDATSYTRKRETMAVMKDLLREKEGWWKEELKEQVDKAKDDYELLPARLVQQAVMNRGELKFGALDREKVEAAIGKPATKKLGATVTKPGGQDPEAIAEFYKYPTAKGMLEDLAALPDKTAWANATADARMRVAHPELLDEIEKLHVAVDKGLHGDLDAKQLERELVLLSTAMTVPGQPLHAMQVKPIETAKAAARQSVENRTVERLDAGAALAAERRSATEAMNEAAKGNRSRAFLRFLERVTNFYIWKDLLEARAMRDDTIALAGELSTRKSQGRLGKASPVYRDEVANALGELGLSDDTGAPFSVDAVIAQMKKDNDEGRTLVEVLDPKVLDPIFAKVARYGRGRPLGSAYKVLTVAEMRHVKDMLEAIKAAAKNVTTVEVEGKRIEAQEAIEQTAAAILRSMPPLPPRSSRGAGKVLDDVGRGFTAASVAQERPETWLLHWLGGVENYAWKAIGKPLQQAKHAESDLLNGPVRGLVEAYEKMPFKVAKRSSERIDGAALFPEMVTAMKGVNEKAIERRWQFIEMLKHMGNASNEKKMTAGFGIQPQQVWDAALKLGITKEEWDYVQATWDSAESLKKPAFDLEEKDTGIRPEEIVARPVQTPYGVLRGGYHPIAYHPGTKQGMRHELSLSPQGFASIGTSNGSLISRVDFTGIVSLDPYQIQRHLLLTAHDIAFRIPLRSVALITRSKEVHAAMLTHLGEERTKAVEKWLEDTGQQRQVEEPRVVYDAMQFLRGAMSTSVLGYSVGNSLEDLVTGVMGAMPGGKIRPDYWAAAFKAIALDARLVGNLENESGELRSRHKNLNREFTAATRKLVSRMPALPRFAAAAVRDNAFVMAEIIDRQVSAGVYAAAKAQALEGNPTPTQAQEELAIEEAEATVRLLMPGGHIVDSSAIMRNRGLVSAMLVFFRFFNTQYNVTRAHTGRDVFAGKTAKAIFTMSALLLANVHTYAILGSLARGQGPDKGEKWGRWWARKMVTGTLSQFMFLGELADAAWPFIDKATGGPGKLRTVRNNSIAGMVESIGLLIARVMAGDKTVDEKSLMALKAVGLGTGIPPAQALKMATYIDRLARGDVHPRGPDDVLGGLLFGQNKTPSSNIFTILQDIESGQDIGTGPQ